MLPRPNACEERGSLGSGVWRGLPGQAEGGWPTVGKGRGVWMRSAGPGRGRGSLQLQRPCFGAPTNQTDPGLPTESSLRLGPRFPTPPPQLLAKLVAQIVKNSPVIQETWVLFLLGKSSGEGNGNTLCCSCLGTPMDRVAWQPAVQGVAKDSERT